MSDSQQRETETEQTPRGRLSPTRRKFLQATGMAALATGVSAQSDAAAPSEGPGGPGRISNLAAYLEDPQTVAENVEPTHVTTAVPYGSVRAACQADEPFTELESRFAESEYVRLLNGEWRFAFHESPSELPDSYDDLAADDWGSIDVPGVWQTQGHGQRIYANNSITWQHYDPGQEGDLTPGEDGTVDVPGVDDDGIDPVGTYRRTFSVPRDWDGRQTFLHFEAVKQAFFVWIDDEYVGFRTGSMTAAEFDVTDHVEAGGDYEVTVQVYRWSDSEALETIDMFRYAGIFRNVYLFATPTVHLRDFYARTDLDDDYEDGRLRIDAEIANYGDAPAGKYTVRAHLYETDRTKPGRGPPRGKGKENAEAKGNRKKNGRGPGDNPPRGRKVTTVEATATVDEDGAVVTLEADVDDPAKWSAEHPNLYQLALELVDARGETAEAMLEKVGFRTYETTRGQQGAEVLVNGEAVDIQGVNRHETDPDFGRTVPIDRVREDLETMQRFNVNAIRTSHYPNDPSFYRLADEYGIYVQDEVGVETHWWEGLLAHTDAYHDQAVEQFRRMVLRDRNHASIFSWSTGNEAGTGAEHLEMASLAADSDEYIPDDTSEVSGVENVESFDGEAEGFAPDRILYHQPNGGGWNVEYSDMLGPRYPDVGTLLSVADGSYIGDGLRPVAMGEYNHAMGNSLGLVHEMWNEHIKPPAREATDRSDADNPGVLVGTPEVVPGPDVEPGAPDGAVVLGESDAIEIRRDESLDVDPGFSVGATVSNVDADADASLVDEGRYALELSDGELVLSIGSDSVSASLPAGGVDDWTTVVGVADADELRLYVDGERVAATSHSVSDLPSSDGPVRIGIDGDAEITVDGIGIYDRAVSDDEASGADGTLSDGAVVAYDFADLIRDQSLVGGFVWDWVNQDLNDVTEDGQEFQFYHSDGPDGAFCLNGLVWSDRDPQPEMWQLKHSHQPVGVADAAVEDGEVYVSNRYNFTGLDALEGSWELTADDETVKSGELDLDIEPGETRRVDVPVGAPSDPEPGVEYRLSVSFALAEATDYADAGHEVAFEQLEIPVDAPEPEPESLDAMAPLSVEEGDDIVISGDGFEYVVSGDAGTLSSMRYGGSELVEDGPLFNAWRAPIMNEHQQWGSAPAFSWYEAGLNDLTHSVDSVETNAVDDSLVQLTVDGFAAGTEVPPPLLTPDASGEGNDGEVVGDPDVVSGQSGQAVALDGESQHVNAGNDASVDFGEPGFTIQVRFKGVPANGEHNPFVSKGDHQYALKISSSDEFQFFIYQDTWITHNAPIPSGLAEDEWHTLTGVATDDELQLYLDGETLGSSGHSATSVNQSAFPVHVGHNAENTNRYTETAIDEVRMYDRALSPSEISSGFDEPPESAVLWYELDTFEEGESTVMGFETQYRYRIYGSGDVRMNVEAVPNEPLRNTVSGWLPKVGVQLDLPERFDAFEWYGRGELETYPDRKWSVPVGRYAGSVDEQYVPYLPPTDNGNKAQTRWATLSDGEVSLLGMPGDEDANVSLEQWSNLDEAEHQYELEERGSIGFNLDHRVTGVGGTPTDPIDRYQVEVEPTAFSVVLRPFDPDDADPMELANRRLPDADE
ncbi:glycoside hydrolase family 2 sugar binding protein (plasmid) [Haloterrigena turkmenica DSM 5511]|uniref:beta-galactosidase n=1 Tax=Haloterrigena turkmenica (strain ATCC 51198 / DSM 5511 / JCM 9101 / NCIMB 13204 / VKM B-1734 / 4k) TaxID=543526 RepID=D2S068_HALTV|nr:glycoside hydrolase family 2 TIM barrel-domain containing protein [Haloterrigena turkmenica]ADB62765.1 glycoside hydrolase family 2 sugar binding protein [Haloterrigena turkmenica DSM 5511]